MIIFYFKLAKRFDRFWIGLSTLSTNSGFVWSDGSPVSYTNWNAGEPNNFLGQENCVEMNAYNSKYIICTLKKII
jgi:hypothetical protein